MDDLRDEVLAGAALARDQHRRTRAGGDFSHQRLDALHRLRLADDGPQRERTREVVPKRPQLPAQPRRLERPVHAQRHILEIERLCRVVERPALHGFHNQLDVLVGREHHDEHIGVELTHLAQHREAVAIRQLVIEQDEVHAAVGALERFGGRARLDDVVAARTEALDQRPPNEFLVVNDEYAAGHGDEAVYGER